MGKDLVITGLEDFDLKHIFECGQCFRWNMTGDDEYTGVAMGRALKISQHDGIVTMYETPLEDFQNIWFDYFDLGRNYGDVKRTLAVDNVMKEAVRYGGGIRILKQDLWETVISFIISASNNIPRIKGIIERLCELAGNKIEYMGNVYYSFPDIDTLSKMSEKDLSPIRAGFRDKYIVDAAQKFKNGALSADYIGSLSTGEARKALMSINGVGNKVANCILLFALARVESFPIDVWIKRVMEHFYFEEEQSIGAIADFADRQFGALGGFAQQYLFFYAREEKIGLQKG